LPRRPYSHILLLTVFTAGLILASCSVEKNTSATRNFHNMTSHYNIYFNGYESYKTGLLRAETGIVDNYTKILPLFYYEDEPIRQNISPQMQRAIDKASKVATFHSIKAKPKVKEGNQSEKQKAFYDKKEYNKWMDDSYVLIGKAYMHQGEFFLASESFKHVIKTFPEEDSYYLSLTWLARAYNMIGELDEAEEILVNLYDLEEFPEDYNTELYTTLADYYLKTEDYEKAAEYLELALDTKIQKGTKIRYTYILAQIYSELKSSDEAIDNFKKVVRMNPPYVMSFNAKVSMAGAFKAGGAGSNDIKKVLNKMLRDSKNTEYLDQIYFALANILMEEGEREKAIEYYHLSVAKSVQNNFQKGESCVTLANIYYNEPIYTMSAAYYDTAVNLLESDYPNYPTLMMRSRSLNKLVRNVNAYEMQDSVQILAGMTEADRFAVIDGIIADVVEREAEVQRRELEAMQELQYNRSELNQNQMGGGNTQTGAGGKWYFYNLNAKSFGQPEFRMRWGERKLEDNWRRSNKQTVTELIDEDEIIGTNEVGDGGTEILDNKTREFYLRNIPLTDSAMKESHIVLEEALYNMGLIYQKELLDYDKAIESLEEVSRRYPDGDFTMGAYYHLYELYNSKQLPARADFYKDQLSRKYPDSHMAKLLTNPNYINELEEEANKVERYYETVFNSYRNEDYAAVLRDVEYGFSEFGDDADLVLRLRYLKAISIGSVHGKEVMKIELDSIVAQHPDTDIGKQAQEIISYMYVAFPVIKEADQVKEAEAIYVYDSTAIHYFIIGLKSTENLNLVNFNLLNYNLDNFNAYDLQIELTELGSGYNLLMVKDFTDFEGTNRYSTRIKQDISLIMGELSEDSYELCLISQNNYQNLLQEKEFVPYLLFYRKFYMGN
jgi:tetratricopeptide (TPR) repeat protein